MLRSALLLPYCGGVFARTGAPSGFLSHLVPNISCPGAGLSKTFVPLRVPGAKAKSDKRRLSPHLSRMRHSGLVDVGTACALTAPAGDEIKAKGDKPQ